MAPVASEVRLLREVHRLAGRQPPGAAGGLARPSDRRGMRDRARATLRATGPREGDRSGTLTDATTELEARLEEAGAAAHGPAHAGAMADRRRRNPVDLDELRAAPTTAPQRWLAAPTATAPRRSPSRFTRQASSKAP
jgi:hypothetical protein